MSEPVLTVHDYYDGPVLGIAHFEGAPHTYNRIFDDTTDDWTNAYLLQPVGTDELTLVLEDWAIWCRFFSEWRAGRAPMAPPFCLSVDEGRSGHIRPIAQAILERKGPTQLIRIAEFVGWRSRHEERPWQVTWKLPPSPLPGGWRLPPSSNAA